jgi:hypothetical protein
VIYSYELKLLKAINTESTSYNINGILALRIYMMPELLVDAAKK